ncbi:MAG: GDP-mannose 4,6-dehydratase [Flavobacteriales bacterium]|nr:GDP-mannose 4,6-dehydratase [Flavobacteriales bacterium]
MMRKLRDKNVLVTGGAGFIGSNLCEDLLDCGNRVVCFDNFATGKRENVAPFLSHPNFKLIEADIRYGDLFGVETIGLRYFNVFGKRQTPDGAYAAAIPKFIRAFIDHESPVLHGDGKQTRDFTYIANVIQMNHLAATTDNPKAVNKVYNTACGDRTDLLHLIEKIREALVPFDPEIADVPVAFGPSREGDVRDSLADVSRAKELLDYAPTHRLGEGIKEAIAWYWENLKNG